jgi:hypothetical protein
MDKPALIEKVKTHTKDGKISCKGKCLVNAWNAWGQVLNYQFYLPPSFTTLLTVV